MQLLAIVVVTFAGAFLILLGWHLERPSSSERPGLGGAVAHGHRTGVRRPCDGEPETARGLYGGVRPRAAAPGTRWTRLAASEWRSTGMPVPHRVRHGPGKSSSKDHGP